MEQKRKREMNRMKDDVAMRGVGSQGGRQGKQ